MTGNWLVVGYLVLFMLLMLGQMLCIKERRRDLGKGILTVTIYGVILCDVHWGLCVEDCVMTETNPVLTL